MRIHKALEYNENIEQIKNTITGYRQEMMRDLRATNRSTTKEAKTIAKFVNYIMVVFDHLRIVFYENRRKQGNIH